MILNDVKCRPNPNQCNKLLHNFSHEFGDGDKFVYDFISSLSIEIYCHVNVVKRKNC